MSPRYWPSPFFNFFLGTALGLCLFNNSFAQTPPLSTPTSVKYPGILQTFEKLLLIDAEKFKNKKAQLVRNGRANADLTSANGIELDPDFLNSVILHSDPGYIKLASTSKCRFYDTLLNDLLKSAEGKVESVLITYVTKGGSQEAAVVNRKDFLTKVVNIECPETKILSSKYQVKVIDETLKGLNFKTPTGLDQCRASYLDWLENPHTPYLCRVHEYMKEAKAGAGNPKDLQQRQALTRILERKINPVQADYISNICSHLDNEKLFCDSFLNVTFWNKVSTGLEDKIYAEDICKQLMGVLNPSEIQLQQCLNRMKKENDACLYPGGTSHGITPQPHCEILGLALNHSSLRSNYRDCPGNSDQHAITNLGRILLNISKEKVLPSDGPCSNVSTGVALAFNKKFNNEENWNLEACYTDKIAERDICYKTYFGSYGDQAESYNNVVSRILQVTRGADPSVKCRMVESKEYNPQLLGFKSGCHIIYDRTKCFASQCENKIIYNDKVVDNIRVRNRLTLEYFPNSIKDERYSQHYLLTRDYGQKGKSLNNMTSVNKFFKKSPSGIIHGVGCAENLLPGFFKARSLNQCSPLPFIVDGMVKERDKVAFVTRTSVDSLQAPRLMSWSTIFSAVKSYQTLHPLKLWTLYGLD